jgi:inner membrane protein
MMHSSSPFPIMENIAHTLTGLALARAGLGRTPLATAALVLGANLPDVDLLWSLRSDLAYLHFHRGWTHSLVGALSGSVALWVALLAIGWWRRGRQIPRAGPLLLACAAGVWSHVLLDASNSYGLRPFLPWNGRWVYGDLWHIVDPWLWLVLGTAVFLSGRGGRRRAWTWIAAAVGLTLLVVVLPIPIVAPGTRVAFAAGLAIAVVVAVRGTRGRGAAFAPRVGLAIVVAYAAGCAILHGTAVARVEALLPGNLEARAALPRFGDPVRWDGVTADRRTVRYRVVSSFSAIALPANDAQDFPRNLDDPRVVEILDSCAGKVIDEFFRFPFAVIDAAPSGDGHISVRDARYSRDSDGFASVTVPLARGLPDLARLACP